MRLMLKARASFEEWVHCRQRSGVGDVVGNPGRLLHYLSMTSGHGLTGSLAGFPVPETVPPEIIPELTGSGWESLLLPFPLFP